MRSISSTYYYNEVGKYVKGLPFDSVICKYSLFLLVNLFQFALFLVVA